MVAVYMGIILLNVVNFDYAMTGLIFDDFLLVQK